MGIYGELQKLNKAPSRAPAGAPDPGNTLQAQRHDPNSEPKNRDSNVDTMQPRNRGVMKPRNHATVIPRHHDTMIETLRGAVKLFGKEAATHRFTLEEKQVIADVVYAYKGQNIRTSENEITRISVNYILADYRENGENSILHRVLTALNH